MFDGNKSLIFFSVIVGFLMVDVFCNDPGRNRNSWQINNINNGFASQILLSNMSTTPWPTLNQRRNQNNNHQTVRVQNGTSWIRNSPTPTPVVNKNNNHQTMWVQNGTNWIRNSPNTPVVPNRSQNMPDNSGRNNVMSNTRPNDSRVPPRGSPNSPNMPVPNTPFNTAVKFVTNPTTSMNNNRNNVNVNFLNNERTNIPGGNFSSGPFKENQVNMTVKEGSSKDKSNGDVSDDELRDFSETLLSKDTNNLAKYVTLNVQKMTSSRSTVDEAPLPLLSVDSAAFSVPSVSKLVQLHNNYILETNQNEVYTSQEKLEENDFLDTILSTPVMQNVRNFLIQKGKLGKDPKEFKDLLRTLWFNMYSRGGGRIGSSGFEHVFLAELKNSKVSGLHNWLYFYDEEKKRNANYLGYLKKLDLGNKGAILRYHFVLHGTDKPVASMFVGTSPELEIGLYTTCFVLRADRICPLKLNGNRFIIRTYTYRYRGKNMIGSAFPEI